MSIEVTGNYRPGRPKLAILVSAGMLLLVVAGAAIITQARNRPIRLTPLRQVPQVPGLSMAWPADWEEIRLPSNEGPAVAAVRSNQRILMLLYEPIDNRRVPPGDAAMSLLQGVARQLGIRRARDVAAARSELLGEPAIDLRYVANFGGTLLLAQLRGTAANGAIAGLLLLTPEQISPADERLFNEVAASMQIR